MKKLQQNAVEIRRIFVVIFFPRKHRVWHKKCKGLIIERNETSFAVRIPHLNTLNYRIRGRSANTILLNGQNRANILYDFSVKSRIPSTEFF